MRIIRLTVLIIGALFAVSGPAAAQQFKTPDRQFHNQTSFPLEGRHRAVECASCHIRDVYKGTPSGCVDCHWVRRQDDRYRLQLGSQCEQCHRTTNWTDVRWDHGAMTAMPLNGAHRQVACASCHRDNVFRNTDMTCATCHTQDYQATRTPNHAAAGFPMTCETCHKASDTSFTGARFDHAVVFPLTGAHAQQTCASCHVNNVYRGTPRDCVGCHQDDYTRTTTPNHAAAGFPTTCETCHRSTDPSWRGNGFNHAAVFPLAGAHAQQTCATCHVNNVYRGTARDCVGCHQDEYNRTTAPNHAAAGLPTTCESCHRNTDVSWRGAGFNHAAVFPLVGSHAQQTCSACHVNSVYRGTPRDCVGCHQDDFNRTTTPNHAAAGFPTTCESCHREADVSWRGSGFNHAAVFPLVGAHAQQTCATCHVNNVYRGTARDCVGCHQGEFNRTTAPNHAAAGFPTTCETCHRGSDATWRQAVFDHASTFPLQGRHAQQACATCHVNNVYRGTARDCVGCHQDEYARTTAPNHASAGFPTTCESCHRAADASWQQGSFNHRFPITSGPHRQTCATCHTSGGSFQVFTCIVCHDHSRTRMDDKHKERTGYRYDSLACYACHPTGRGCRGGYP